MIWEGKGDVRECNSYRGVTLLSVPGKVLARILLNRIRQHLLDHQRPEQSRFTPLKSTVDRNLALRVLIERRREFQRWSYAAYVGLRKAFDWMDRDVLWRILALRGIRPKLGQLISGLYSGTKCCVVGQRQHLTFSQFMWGEEGAGQAVRNALVKRMLSYLTLNFAINWFLL